MKIIIGAKPTSGLYMRQQPREGAQSVPVWLWLGPLPTVQGGVAQMPTTQLCWLLRGRDSEAARSFLREPF